jgi:predicted RNase H-like HicB family nuclease
MTHDNYRITVEQEGKHYFAYCKNLPGVYGLGASLAQTKTSILKAIDLYKQCKKMHRAKRSARTAL